ncbi:MAG: DUF948 domain-containing protein [Calditrichia bacterium]
MIIEISVAVVSLAVVVLIIFLIPAVIQFRRSARSLEEASNQFNQKTTPVLENLEAITANINQITASGRDQMEALSEVVSEVKMLVDDVANFQKNLQNKIEDPIIETLTTITAVTRAIRVFLVVFLDKK